MKAWIYQDPKQVKKKGADKASWYVGWYDPDGKQRCKSFGPGTQGERNAEKYRRRVEGELAAGTYEHVSRKTWSEFRKEFDAKVLADLEPGTRQATNQALARFEELIAPKRMSAITTKTIAAFVAGRRKGRGLKKDSTVSKATVNKELRHLKRVLRIAKKWKHLAEVPEFEFLRETKRLPEFVTPEQFVRIYDCCTAVSEPSNLPNVHAADWWRGLFLTAYMTGWRIGELLALRWADVDLDEGTAITRGDENKGRRDSKVALHDLVVEHLRTLKTFRTHVFPWNASRRSLYKEFHRIQVAAGVAPVKGRFGFHDLRRGFATMNADRMSADALQSLMRHASYQTTQVYINLSRQLKPAAANLFVPDIARRRPG